MWYSTSYSVDSRAMSPSPRARCRHAGAHAGACVALLAVLGRAAAAGSSSSCTVTASWPDGSEVERECIVEGEGGKKSGGGGGSRVGKISPAFSWLRDTQWHWNDWRDVVFRADGSFLAPAEGCERSGNPNCSWWTDDETVMINWGGAGVHKMQASGESSMSGYRVSDGEGCHAERVS